MHAPSVVTTAHMILYVVAQDASTAFYAAVLGIAPRLNVPGMTEFDLAPGAVLGLMPEAGIRRLLGSALPDAESMESPRVSRAELYLMVEDPEEYMARATMHGAKLLSPVLARDWGHRVGYCQDPDGYVLAFAAAAAH